MCVCVCVCVCVRSSIVIYNTGVCTSVRVCLCVFSVNSSCMCVCAGSHIVIHNTGVCGGVQFAMCVAPKGPSVERVSVHALVWNIFGLLEPKLERMSL
jgi:hypothetical protein